jgi:hypothetical protein
MFVYFILLWPNMFDDYIIGDRWYKWPFHHNLMTKTIGILEKSIQFFFGKVLWSPTKSSYIFSYYFFFFLLQLVSENTLWGTKIVVTLYYFSGYHVWMSTMSLLWNIFTMFSHVMVDQNPKKFKCQTNYNFSFLIMWC